MRPYFSLLVLLVSVHALANGGNGSSGGGAAYVCRDANKNITSAGMLDTYEGQFWHGLNIPISSVDPTTQLRAALARMTDDYRRNLIADTADRIFANLSFLPAGVEMSPIDDLGGDHPPVKPSGCELTAVGFYVANGVLKVSRDIYEALPMTDRAAFVLHEAIYKIARDTSGAKDSAASRKLVADLFSTDASASVIQNDGASIFFQNDAGFANIAYEGTQTESYSVSIIPDELDKEFGVEVECRDLPFAQVLVSKQNTWRQSGVAHFTVSVPGWCPRLGILVDSDHTVPEVEIGIADRVLFHERIGSGRTTMNLRLARVSNGPTVPASPR